ncbi:MAG: hypothetical protein WDW38_002110 [Sanguina aurantia]
MAGLQHEFLDVNGIKIHVVSTGRDPSKPLMLLVHGFPECWYSWRHQMREFAGEYEVVAMDMRGYGESDKPQGAASYAAHILASDVRGVAMALGRTHIDLLVGHDWGGAVCWYTAGIYGTSLIRKLSIIAAPHWGLYFKNLDFSQALASWYMLLFKAPLLPEVMLMADDAAVIGGMFTPGGPGGPVTPGCMDSSDIEVYKQALQRPGAVTAALNYYRASLGPRDVSPEAEQARIAMKRRISIPTLVLWGEKDTALLPHLNNGLDQVCLDSRVVVLPGCSHWVQQDKPAETNALLRQFLLKGNKLSAL